MDAIVDTLFITGCVLQVAMFIFFLVAIRGKDPDKDDVPDFVWGMGCMGVFIGISLWVLSFVVWLTIHIRIV